MGSEVHSLLNIWHLNQEMPREFMLLTYEDMHMATEEVLRRRSTS